MFLQELFILFTAFQMTRTLMCYQCGDCRRISSENLIICWKEQNFCGAFLVKQNNNVVLDRTCGTLEGYDPSSEVKWRSTLRRFCQRYYSTTECVGRFCNNDECNYWNEESVKAGPIFNRRMRRSTSLKNVINSLYHTVCFIILCYVTDIL